MAKCSAMRSLKGEGDGVSSEMSNSDVSHFTRFFCFN